MFLFVFVLSSFFSVLQFLSLWGLLVVGVSIFFFLFLVLQFPSVLDLLVTGTVVAVSVFVVSSPSQSFSFHLSGVSLLQELLLLLRFLFCFSVLSTLSQCFGFYRSGISLLQKLLLLVFPFLFCLVFLCPSVSIGLGSPGYRNCCCCFRFCCF